MKIGIITLHKVINYGSALQAYALQKYLQNQRPYDEVEIIDYIFPNAMHKSKPTFMQILKSIARWPLEKTIRKTPQKVNCFKSFYNKYFSLSCKRYECYENIHNYKPQYDLYITGSDQVWNPRTLKGDTTMYCSFAPEGSRKISFGASFTENKLSPHYSDIAKQWLSSYSHIGVREESGLGILDDLNLPPNIETICTCDPTLLLDAVDYTEIAKESTIKINGEYILVYYLGYAYNPQPAMSNVVEKIAKETGYQVIVIGENKFKYSGKYRRIDGFGPVEYLSLFANASYVVTSSFHGTMFSLINRVPFYSIVPQGGHKDSRTKDVLSIIGLSQRGIAADYYVQHINLDNPFNKEVTDKLNNYVRKSKQYLNNAIK